MCYKQQVSIIKREIQDDEPILIDVQEACKIMNLGRNTMLKLVKISGFPALRLPGKILIDKRELPDWIRKNYGQFED